MPVDLYSVRHGESEGNLANRLLREDRADEVPEAIYDVYGANWRLSPLGVTQAIAAGNWLRENAQCNKGIHSWYTRAVETAYYLNLPDVLWKGYYRLRERDVGDFDKISRPGEFEDKERIFKERYKNPLYAIAPNGQMLVDKMEQVDRAHETLRRESDENTVFVMVSHGETMLAQWILMAHLGPEEAHNLVNSKDPKDKIRNCQIIHYTRKEPDTGKIFDRIRWFRSFCPWDITDPVDTLWREISRKKNDLEGLKREFERHPRCFSD